MRTLITGKTKLAGAIMSELHEKIVYQKLEVESTRAEAEIPWKYFDIFINCAAVNQTELLNDAFGEWKGYTGNFEQGLGAMGRPKSKMLIFHWFYKVFTCFGGSIWQGFGWLWKVSGLPFGRFWMGFGRLRVRFIQCLVPPTTLSSPPLPRNTRHPSFSPK